MLRRKYEFSKVVKAIIFDLDDTLISEKQYIESGYQHIASFLSKKYEMDVTVLYILLINLFKDSPKNVFNRLLENIGVSYTDSNITELVKEYRTHSPKISFYSDVIPCLELLKKSKIKTGVITDGYAIAQNNKLMALNASNYFDEIIVTDELGREFWKPHPKAFEIMREKLNVEFNEMIYIGDNPEKDFYISTLYPVKTIRVLRKGVYSKSTYKDNVKENYIVDDLLEVLNILKNEL